MLHWICFYLLAIQNIADTNGLEKCDAMVDCPPGKICSKYYGQKETFPG